ncbi:ABC-F family ATP-binding cassette domain-containing protein [Veronia nyctiphanis]|uniref:ABC-F family ATP-binding cassette domain-containing protein n=1 Tax=Veronia nyctiphanis TaxID=1278244 RepID=UPI002E274CB8
MSTLLSAKQVSYHTTSGPLMDDITFTVSRGNRIGLVGHNGCGKSTLLKLLTSKITAEEGEISLAKHCHIEHVEQHLPPTLSALTMHEAVSERLSDEEKQTDIWRVDVLLNEMGFNQADMSLTAGTLSGGEHTRLLLARALINNPDLLLLDEPSNHMDLPTLFWLESFLKAFKGGFLLVSHDQKLLDAVTDSTWIMRDRTLYSFALPCSAARTELAAMDEADEASFKEEQKEIDRVAKSAKRLAVWGHTYDNEDLSRKAKTMEKRVETLKANQTELSEGTPWQLKLKGTALPANRLLEINNVDVRPADDADALYLTPELQLKSGDKVAILGQNGTGKSSLLRMLWQRFAALQGNGSLRLIEEAIRLHPKSKVGYYDQTLQQLDDGQTMMEALSQFAPLPTEALKMALIKAGFPYARHQQTIEGLSGGERSRLLFVGLTLADYHMLMLDEPQTTWI